MLTFLKKAIRKIINFFKRKTSRGRIDQLEARIVKLEKQVRQLKKKNSSKKESITIADNSRKNYTTQNANVDVILGEMNGPESKHPASIIATCFTLNAPLPKSAKCAHQPSYYLGKDAFDGTIESITHLLEVHLPNLDPVELEQDYKSFNKKFHTQNNLEFTGTDMTIYFCDWYLYAKGRGFSYNDYFDYELYNKEPNIRDTFLNEGYRVRVYAACNKAGFRRVLHDKARFNRKFKKFVQRDWVDASVCTYDEFLAFADKHERFFGKPIRGTGGAGARVIERNSDTLENLYELCKNEGLILEELIKQHPSLAEFNSSTLNTVRVNTLLCADGEVRVTLAVARFGRAGNAVDNFHGGGVGAIVDIDSGIIISEAINRAHVRSAVHPDSQKAIVGFQYPEWEKLKAAVCQSARKLPNIRHVGWDVAVKEDGNIEFVEGNGRPNFDVLQSPDQLGRRFRYTPYLPAIEELEGLTREELAPLVIDITGMEAE